MNITPITTSAIPRTGLAAIVGVEAIAAPLDPLALPAAAGAELDAGIVALSNPGRLLSAAAAFEAQPTGAGFGDLVSATRLFIDALNQLQSSSTDLVQNPLGSPFGNVLLLALDAAPQSGGGESLRAGLAQAGITFQETLVPANAGQFTVDIAVLQAAFDADPAATSALLREAFQTLARFAASLAARNLDLFATATNSISLGSASASLSDVDVLAGPFANLNRVDAAAVDAALQRLQAEQAPSGAAHADNPTTATVPAATAPAPVAPERSPIKLNGTAADPFAATASVTPTSAGSRPSSRAAGGLPDGIRAAPVSAAVFQDFAAPAGVIAAAPNGAANGAPTPLPQDFNNLRFREIDPSVAAAIAAYRVGDGFFGPPATATARPLPELVADIAAVTRVRPVTLDLHQGAADAWRSRAARHAVTAVERRDLLAASYSLASSPQAVNLAV